VKNNLIPPIPALLFASIQIAPRFNVLFNRAIRGSSNASLCQMNMEGLSIVNAAHIQR